MSDAANLWTTVRPYQTPRIFGSRSLPATGPSVPAAQQKITYFEWGDGGTGPSASNSLPSITVNVQTYNETGRTFEKRRIENPDDKSQYVVVEDTIKWAGLPIGDNKPLILHFEPPTDNSTLVGRGSTGDGGNPPGSGGGDSPPVTTPFLGSVATFSGTPRPAMTTARFGVSVASGTPMAPSTGLADPGTARRAMTLSRP